MHKFLFLLFIFIFNSCSTPRPAGKTEAEVLYKEAEELVKDGRFILATERLNNIRSHYPYSYYATYAELLQADILFEQESYVDASAAYIAFRDFHPKYKDIEYVTYRIAECFFLQIPPTVDRDLTPAFEAIKYFKELISLYPSSKFTSEAKKKVDTAFKMIVDKEKYIADFYYKTEVYDAAIYRYKDIIRSFSDKELRNYAMLGLVKSYKKLNDPESCKKYFVTNKRLISNTEELNDTYSDCIN